MNRKEGSVYYEIRVKGLLDPAWSEWFEELTITPLPQGETQISGWITDESALHGILVRIRNLNLALLSVKRFDERGGPGPEEVDL
jgi:hypothetical protein